MITRNQSESKHICLRLSARWKQEAVERSSWRGAKPNPRNSEFNGQRRMKVAARAFTSNDLDFNCVDHNWMSIHSAKLKTGSRKKCLDTQLKPINSDGSAQSGNAGKDGYWSIKQIIGKFLENLQNSFLLKNRKLFKISADNIFWQNYILWISKFFKIANRRKKQSQKRRKHSDRADCQSFAQANQFAQCAGNQSTEHHHSDIDEAKTCGHSTLQMIRCYRLSQTHQIDAVELNAESVKKVRDY